MVVPHGPSRASLARAQAQSTTSTSSLTACASLLTLLLLVLDVCLGPLMAASPGQSCLTMVLCQTTIVSTLLRHAHQTLPMLAGLVQMLLMASQSNSQHKERKWGWPPNGGWPLVMMADKRSDSNSKVTQILNSTEVEETKRYPTEFVCE